MIARDAIVCLVFGSGRVFAGMGFTAGADDNKEAFLLMDRCERGCDPFLHAILVSELYRCCCCDAATRMH